MKTSDLTLRLVESPGDAWNGVIAPWCDRVLPECWKRARPAAIVVPTRGHANALKQRLLDEGHSYFGLHFITPRALREMLARQDDVTPPAAEDLRLLLALAASELPDDLTAKAVARSPGSLLQTLNRLQVAGWDFKQLALPTFAPVVRRFHELLRRCGFRLPGQMERERLSDAAKSSPLFSDVLVTGFDGAHWAEWLLLRAAVTRADKATVLLEEPRSFQEIDLCWIGSWEEIGGEAQRGTLPSAARRDALFTDAEMRGESPAAPSCDFLVGFNFSEQAAAIARQCVNYLQNENCTRLGIIFPAAGALPRLVAGALTRLGIPHNDNIAHILPGIFESPEWQAWLDLQRAPRLQSLLKFINALPDSAAFSLPLGRRAFERILRHRYSEWLIDDLEVLQAACLAAGDEKSQLAAQVLRDLPFLPPRATLAEFIQQTQAALDVFDWRQRSIELAFADRAWTQRLEAVIPRALFLRWLDETAQSFGAERASSGDHPYARVQLLTVAHAQNQEWSHLIFAGWNDGAWPPPARAEFARDEEIRAFNARVQQLNQRAARPGKQGEGHCTVRENFSLYLGPAEQRGIALRQFEALRESATEGVALAISLVHEDAPERLWNPSETFSRLYFTTHQTPLTQKALKQLREQTALLPGEKLSADGIEQTAVAFHARRDLQKPAGEFDFAFRPNEATPPSHTFSVSDFEAMVRAPGIVWMKHYLGVEAPEDYGNPWSASSGQWVHRWLAGIGEAKSEKLFRRFPSASEIDQRLRDSSLVQRVALEELCRSLGKTVPDWWNSGWGNARYLARHLGAKLATAKGWNWMAAEFAFGQDGPVQIAEGVALSLRGRLDLILATEAADNFRDATLWVLDYKTGSTKKPTTRTLHDTLIKGSTLQLGLYVLALRGLGAAEVDASLLGPAIREVAPQLKIADLLPFTEIFRDLAEMQRTGHFGMKGDLRAAFGYAPTYPLATLAIDSDVLEDKWALTHQNLVLEKEEWEVS